jgi:hypothetical protein
MATPVENTVSEEVCRGIGKIGKRGVAGTGPTAPVTLGGSGSPTAGKLTKTGAGGATPSGRCRSRWWRPTPRRTVQASHVATGLQGLRDRDAVGVLEVTTHRQAAGDARDAHAVRRHLSLHVEGRGLPFE